MAQGSVWKLMGAVKIYYRIKANRSKDKSGVRSNGSCDGKCGIKSGGNSDDKKETYENDDKSGM